MMSKSGGATRLTFPAQMMKTNMTLWIMKLHTARKIQQLISATMETQNELCELICAERLIFTYSVVEMVVY